MPKRKPRKVRKRKNPRTKLIEDIDDIMFDILCYERGERCELCGATHTRLGLFHIMPKGHYPRIRFNKQNLLIAGWFCCHLHWHHTYYIARDRIYPKIVELRGENFEDELRKMDLTSRPLDTVYLKVLKRALEKELRALERGWQNVKA